MWPAQTLFLWKERTDLGGHFTSFNDFSSFISSKLYVRGISFSKLDFGSLSSIFFISCLITLTSLSFSFVLEMLFRSLSSTPLFSARCFFLFLITYNSFITSAMVWFFFPSQYLPLALPSPFRSHSLSCHFTSFFNTFIYLFLAALGLCCCTWPFSSCGEWGLLFVALRGLLITAASLVVEHGL